MAPGGERQLTQRGLAHGSTTGRRTLARAAERPETGMAAPLSYEKDKTMTDVRLHDAANDNDVTGTGDAAERVMRAVPPDAFPAAPEPRATRKRGGRRWFAGGVVLVALCAFLLGGTAFAQTGSTTGSTLGSSFITRLAQSLGISTDALQSKITDSANQTIDDAVTSGQITQAQADDMKQQIASEDAGQLFGGLFGGRGPGGFHGGHIDLATVASTLGMNETDLQTALASGTTLSDIITQHGKTVDQVVTALVAQEKTELDARVTAGQLTQAQEDQMLSALPQQLTDAINNNLIGGHHGRPNDNDADDIAPGTVPDTTPGTSATPTT